MRVKISELRERVTIKSPTSTADNNGGYVETFTTTVATVWAKINAAGSEERTAGMRVEMPRRYTVIIRFRANQLDTQPNYRLYWTAHTGVVHELKILGTYDLFDERKRFLVLTCEECQVAVQ